MNTRLLFVCVFDCLFEFYLKRIFNGNINYILYVILSKQVCYFEFTNLYYVYILLSFPNILPYMN